PPVPLQVLRASPQAVTGCCRMAIPEAAATPAPRRARGLQSEAIPSRFRALLQSGCQEIRVPTTDRNPFARSARELPIAPSLREAVRLRRSVIQTPRLFLPACEASCFGEK